MKTMTLRRLLIATTAALLGLTACSTSDEAERAETPAPTEQIQQAQTPPEETMDEPMEGEAHTAMEHRQKMMEACPMQVEGTTRNVVQLDDAVAMDFTTTGDVAQLRERVQKMAQMHQHRHSEGGRMHGKKMHGSKHGKKMHGGMHDMTPEERQEMKQMMQMMSQATVETEEIEGGMRMKFTPEDPAQLPRLQEMMMARAPMMGRDGQCPMMQMMEEEEMEKEQM